MLDNSYFFECRCGSDEHTLRFVLDKEDNEIYVSIFLNKYQNIFKRICVAIKYVFGYKCKFGHWDNWIMCNEDIDKLQKMINDFKNIMDFHYDKKADVLYAYIDSPIGAISVEIENGILIRIEPKSKRVIGFTIIDYMKRINDGLLKKIPMFESVELPKY